MIVSRALGLYLSIVTTTRVKEANKKRGDNLILSQEEKAARARYMRKYRERNPLQYAEQQKRYWSRKVRELRAKEAQKEKEN